MTQEVMEEGIAEPTAEELQQTEQAAFEAGFSGASGEEPPAEEAPVEDAEPDTEPEETPAEDAPEEEIAGLPASKVRELLARVSDQDQKIKEYEQHRDRLYGMVGSLKQELQKVASQPAQAGGVKLDAAAFKRMRNEYPELADLLAQDLSEAISVGGGGASAAAFDPRQLDPILAQREQAVREQIQRETEARFLAMAHPDWREVATSAEFKLWKEMLAPEVRTALDTSWDSQVIGQGLTEFKAWQQQQRSRSTSKKERLARAVQPTGVPATSDTATELDAFLAGFNAVRGVSR